VVVRGQTKGDATTGAMRAAGFILVQAPAAASYAFFTHHGRVQLVFAGRAHPRDEGGKELIQRVGRRRASTRPRVPVVYLENYDLDLAKLLVSGVDLWRNTRRPPLEASGTSGMKAAHNGVPSLSTVDGWWPESLPRRRRGPSPYRVAGAGLVLLNLHGGESTARPGTPSRDPAR